MRQKQLVQAEEGEDIEINRNGYIYIYVSNSSNIPMFFDDLKVAHTPGPLVEETHYYPFGLTMKGISSKALGSIENKKKFVKQEIDADLEMNWYQFKYRNHDFQIGRFIQIDPVADAYVYNSTYAYAENKVINGIDAEGLVYIKLIHNEDASGNWSTKEVLYYKMSEKEIKKANGTPAGIYNAAAYGPEGKGVKHEYNHANGKTKEEWDNKRKDLESKAGNHGLYSGKGCVTDGFGNYDFNYQPIDWADAIAKRHDEDYQNATATGGKYAGFIEDVRTYQADVDMIERVNNLLSDVTNPFKNNGVSGVNQPFRKGISGEMLNALIGQKLVISALAVYKK